jgi:hypothetical protein
MRVLLIMLLFGLIMLICWPFALLLLLLWPLLWLLSIPFRLFAMIAEALLAFIRSILFLPARLLGHRG